MHFPRVPYRRSAWLILLLVALLPAAGWAAEPLPEAEAAPIAWHLAGMDPLEIAGAAPRTPGSGIAESPLAIGLLALGLAGFALLGSGVSPVRTRFPRKGYLTTAEGLVAS